MEIKDLPAIVMLLVLSAMLIGVGALVFHEFGSSAGTYRTTNTTLAEDVGAVAQTEKVFHQNSTALGISCALLAAQNKTGLQVIPAGNYTFSSACSILAVTSSPYNNTAWLVNYTYTYNDDNTATAAVMSNNTGMITGLSGTWLPLIVTIVCLALIIGLVIASFSGTRRE